MKQTEKNETVSRAGRVLARFVVVLFLVIIALVNKRDTFWPAITWPMFSTKLPQYPGETYVADLFYVVEDSGEGIWVRDADLWGFDRYSVTRDLMAGVLDTQSPRLQRHRRATADLIRYRYPDLTPERIEIWRLTWDIDLDARMPLNFHEPRESVLLTGYSPDGISPTPIAPDTQP